MPDQALANLDLAQPRRVHIVGVGGAGMSAIAEVLVGMGHQVSGTDLKISAALERLESLGVDVGVGHAPDKVEHVELVAVSTAIPASDEEVAAATGRGIPVLSRAQVLAAIARTRRTVAVSGTHGKTTTSAMLALALAEGGLRPSFIVGGRIGGLGTGARWDEGEWLVVEADESDGTFLELPVELAVVTSVEPDHLEHYGDFATLVSAFDRFVAGATMGALVCADDPGAAELGERHGAVTYGRSQGADHRMVDLELDSAGSTFALERKQGERIDGLRVASPGLHNALNGAAAAAAALILGVRAEAVGRALAGFPGVGRRFEWRGENGGVTYIDDYAHLPTEVSAALAAARTGGRRVVCVFQPHRYSRTSALWADFDRSFADADVLVVTDIYSAGEPVRPGVSGRLIVDAVLAADPSRIEHPAPGPERPGRADDTVNERRSIAYLPERRELVAYLRALLRPGDLCLTLGAGDLTSLPDELLRASP